MLFINHLYKKWNKYVPVTYFCTTKREFFEKKFEKKGKGKFWTYIQRKTKQSRLKKILSLTAIPFFLFDEDDLLQLEGLRSTNFEEPLGLSVFAVLVARIPLLTPKLFYVV